MIMHQSQDGKSNSWVCVCMSGGRGQTPHKKELQPKEVMLGTN
jgi:hypothetical protein